MFKSKSLNFKLRASYGCLIVLLLFVGGMNIYLLDKTSKDYEHISQINLPNATLLKDLDSSSREILRSILQYSIKGNEAKDIDAISKKITEH